MSNKKLIKDLTAWRQDLINLGSFSEVLTPDYYNRIKQLDKRIKALSEAEQEPTPCGFFTMPYNTTSATKCSNCGFEKYQHKEAEQEKPKEDDNPLIANDKYAVTDWQEHTEPMSAEELSPLELQATKFLDETDTMQFSEMELLAMFASEQLAKQKEGIISLIEADFVRSSMERRGADGEAVIFWHGSSEAMKELLTHLKK